ncbi:hypothetical protein [Bremerella alba]|uniref:Uncharacterized protein n=1 Tax=Bremerella alba TaxID=980252 RepID=A0A7V9A9N5_9BACT|nr:hypothetical protein [Bremerella alba]MBA2117533.1 hypothetical protein [Bremerella alba]
MNRLVSLISPGLLKDALMVCNVDYFQWPPTSSESGVDLETFSRPLPSNPHPETPYVVVLLKMLSVADEVSEGDEFDQ